jgi:Phosphotransferase enzyme family
MDALADWCTRWLGARLAAKLFEAGNLSAVTGLRLTDGREVVVKVRPSMPRLAGCAAVHRALWRAGFPCPEPLVDLEPLTGFAASAEVLFQDADEPRGGELPAPSAGGFSASGLSTAVLSAGGLARLAELAPDPGSVPGLTPSPSWVAWDHAEPVLWPALEDRHVDLNAYSEPRWLDRVAAAARDLLRAAPSDPVIGHGDWHPENLRWHGSELLAVHDWDSVICQPEPAIAGFAAVSFLGIEAPRELATVADSAAFLAAYQQARGCHWTARDHSAFWAAGLWQRAVDAKSQSLDGDAEQVLTRHEARARLHLAGLSPDLVADGHQA